MNVDLCNLAGDAFEYMKRSKSENTIRAYRSDFQSFQRWCDRQNLVALPAMPETMCMYLAYLATHLKASTIQRKVTAIAQAHKLKGLPSPTTDVRVSQTLSGIRRTIGTAQEHKTAAVVSQLRLMIEALPDSASGARDRCLLLVGFAGAFRRSELVALDVTDVEERTEGLVLHIRKSKTDQEGRGRDVGIPYGSNPMTCPVRAMRSWVGVLGESSGPLFRSINRHGHVSDRRLSGQGVASVIKRAATNAGFEPDMYSGHSLRSGLATTAAEMGAGERAIMNQTGHKSVIVVRRYIQQGSLFRGNVASMVGL